MGTFKLVDGCRPDLDCPCIAICLVTLARPAHGVSGNARKLLLTRTLPDARSRRRREGPDPNSYFATRLALAPPAFRERRHRRFGAVTSAWSASEQFD